MVETALRYRQVRWARGHVVRIGGFKGMSAIRAVEQMCMMLARQMITRCSNAELDSLQISPPVWFTPDLVASWQSGDFTTGPDKQIRIDAPVVPLRSSARQGAKDIYLKQERERLKKAAIDAGCTGWKSRESTMRKMGLAEFLLLDQSALQTLYALSLKTERTRGDNGCFVSPAFAPDNLSLQELADAVVPAPAAPGEKLKRKIAVALGRSFAAMAANSKGGAVSVSVCIAEEGLC
jgi:hypothetical protein